MSLLRSILFNALFYPLSVTYATVMLPCLLTRKTTHLGIHLWARLVLKLMAVTLGIRHSLHCHTPLPNIPHIYASKHQSAWETIAFWVLVPNAIYVMKRELYFLPVIGWWIWRAGNIGIDRKGGGSTVKKMLKEARQRMDEGYNVIIYPEGTRVSPGHSTPYLPGVAILAKTLKKDIIPVALNSGYFWPRNALIKHAGTIECHFLPAISHRQKSNELLQELSNTIESQSQKLAPADHAK